MRGPVGLIMLALDATGVVDGYGAADQARQRLADTAQTNYGAGLMTGFDTGDGFFVGGAQEFCNRRGMNYLLANNQTPVKDLIGSYLRRRGLVR